MKTYNVRTAYGPFPVLGVELTPNFALTQNAQIVMQALSSPALAGTKGDSPCIDTPCVVFTHVPTGYTLLGSKTKLSKGKALKIARALEAIGGDVGSDDPDVASKCFSAHHAALRSKLGLKEWLLSLSEPAKKVPKATTKLQTILRSNAWRGSVVTYEDKAMPVVYACNTPLACDQEHHCFPRTIGGRIRDTYHHYETKRVARVAHPNGAVAFVHLQEGDDRTSV